MLAFWLLALVFGASVFAYLWLVVLTGFGWAVLGGLAGVVVARGTLSFIQRWLVLRESIADRTDPEKRTVETNRYIFWRRIFLITLLVGIYLLAAYELAGIGPGEALVALPVIIFAVLRQLLVFFIFMLVNFTILFGPFLVYGRLGREAVEPGDANYEVKVEDVRGQKSAIEEMSRILRLMEQGRNYVRAGGKRERGVLMVGPPGTGKTMLAKGIASSLHVPILVTSGASFAGMFLGMDVLNVFMLVRAAKKKARRWGGCVIFIDEFDALGSRRSGMGGAGGLGGLGGMLGGFGMMGLNMLLVLMDGVDNPGIIRKALRRMVNVTLDGLFIPRRLGADGRAISLRIPQLRPPRYNILFLAATNRPSVLDEAVTRPGRFGRTITFRMPTREARLDIADLYFGKKKHDPELDTPQRREEFSRVTEGYSPAMIEQALSLALMYAFENGRDAFGWRDLRDAMGNIEAGLAEPVEYTERERLAVARHELGHAVAAKFFLPDAVSVRLSIRMRSGSLGHHRAVGREEEFAMFRSQLAGQLRHILGAIASERVFYRENSSGVSGDLVQATNLACTMVGVCGMGPDQLDGRASQLAVNHGETLISLAEVTQGFQESGTVAGAVLRNPNTRRIVAQVMGAAFVDDWRVMNINRESIDMAAEALMAQGELVGDEIGGLLDSVGLRAPEPSDAYPDQLPLVPILEPERLIQTA